MIETFRKTLSDCDITTIIRFTLNLDVNRYSDAAYKMQGVSALQYFKMFFQAIVYGRRDYENLLPMTIGLGNTKL